MPNQEDVQEGLDNLLENFNRAMIEVGPKSIQLDAPPAVQAAFLEYHAALRRLYA